MQGLKKRKLPTKELKKKNKKPLHQQKRVHFLTMRIKMTSSFTLQILNITNPDHLSDSPNYIGLNPIKSVTSHRSMQSCTHTYSNSRENKEIQSCG